ncbi:MAG: glycoside hydrolase family 43 protein [Opitutales bacterium]|nr:glycoside hydrolase family 43 protein [Opitutales bacterium]
METEREEWVENPVLRGFHPDPSIVRAGADYYVATSTFEWFPGVRLHRSRDLRQWRPLGWALTRREQLDLAGNPDSGGVWAPSLSWSGGRFYLVYTDVKLWNRNPWKVAHNYLVTAEDAAGPWSDPVYLHSRGFDPSLFHDVDGRKYMLAMVWDHRPERERFGGIVATEWDEAAGCLRGETRLIYRGSGWGRVEGPHIYKRGEWYYLLTAEGGTGYGHRCSVARARSVWGPYEDSPHGPLLTAHDAPDHPLQKAGHGSLVETPDGEWYLAHLCARPLGPERRCVLGRETGLQRVDWTEDGWPVVEGGPLPAPRFRVNGAGSGEVPAAKATPFPDGRGLGLDWQSLRRPIEESWCSLRARPGWLRLFGEEALGSPFRQSLVGRRVQAWHCSAAVRMEFSPTEFQQEAGLGAYYDGAHNYFAGVTAEDDGNRWIRLTAVVGGTAVLPEGGRHRLTGEGGVSLRGALSGERLRFFFREDEAQDWTPLGPELDATVLSDDYGSITFTGAFWVLAAFDATGQRAPADFKDFVYEEQ